jgi:3-isopropylmalate/(R)-2-methylmalate dehydratase small subunit
MTIINALSGKGCPILGNDIDTDRIIPARFLKEITFENMGHYLFYDVRFDQNENPKEHTLNEIQYKDASIMVVNDNFGCGSSREHAPQAIMRYGFKAIIGESFAEIFAGNCSQIGVPVVTASASDIATLQAALKTDPSLTISIDLNTKTAQYGDTTITIDIPESRREAFIKGTWNVLELLKQNQAEIAALDARLPYRFH